MASIIYTSKIIQRMICRLFILFLLLGMAPAFGQSGITVPDPALQPFRMKGQQPFKKNLTFAVYKTRRIRRTLGSFFHFRQPSPANLLKVGDIPLYHRDRLRAKDVFRFQLDRNNRPATITESRAILRTDEIFRLIGRQDSSFFGARNVDYLDARIRIASDTTVTWRMLASNLNGSREEDQKGIIRHGDREISFVKTTLLLRELPVNDRNPVSLLATTGMVYAFSVEGEVVAAVSFKEPDRRFWIRENLDQQVKDVIATSAALLTIRRNMYK